MSQSFMNNSFGNGVSERIRLVCKIPQREMPNDIIVSDCYPKIQIQCDISHANINSPARRGVDSLRDVLVPVNEGVLKRLTRTFFESGLTEVLNTAADETTAQACPRVAQLAVALQRVLQIVQQLKMKVLPYKCEQSIETVAKYSQTRDWLRSYVRCIAWHPNCFKIAVSGCDDVVRVYSNQPALLPVLKNHAQKWITAMAWRPLMFNLAVACQKGIFIWSLENNFNKARHAPQYKLLEHSHHTPVTSLAWNNIGTLLVSCSISDDNIIVWNVDENNPHMLRRLGPTCTSLSWSPDCNYLFCATMGDVFRVWNVANKWETERWHTMFGYVQSACWSPCGTFLLFVVSENSILYRVQMQEEKLFRVSNLPSTATPIADLSKCLVGHREVGGQPQALAWDPNGIFLAVIFKDSPCIAVFSTYRQALNMSIEPAYFLTGIGSEYPSCICFQSKTPKNENSVLTIGWSSGRIQYFPLLNL